VKFFRFLITLAFPLVAVQATNFPPAATLVFTNLAGTNAVSDTNAAAIQARLEAIMVQDQDAQDEVDRWIQENQKFEAEGVGERNRNLNQKILKRFQSVREAYDEFIKLHPKNVEARLAYASFLSDIYDEAGERDQLLVAKDLDPTRPSIWNNLANYNGHRGDVRIAFDYYQKAIDLDPNESVYYHNFGTTVYLFRRDAEEHWKINEQQVFDKALTLYSNAMRLDPTNFSLATDVAQSYYGIKPTRLEDALKSWTNAMSIATTPFETQGVHIHLARTKLAANLFDEARAHIAVVNDPKLEELRARVKRNIEFQESAARTNSTPAPTDAPILKQKSGEEK
jgi:tetratricopeptide (TPR) repeat protein